MVENKLTRGGSPKPFVPTVSKVSPSTKYSQSSELRIQKTIFISAGVLCGLIALWCIVPKEYNTIGIMLIFASVLLSLNGFKLSEKDFVKKEYADSFYCPECEEEYESIEEASKCWKNCYYGDTEEVK